MITIRHVNGGEKKLKKRIKNLKNNEGVDELWFDLFVSLFDTESGSKTNLVQLAINYSNPLSFHSTVRQGFFKNCLDT